MIWAKSAFTYRQYFLVKAFGISIAKLSYVESCKIIKPISNIGMVVTQSPFPDRQ